MKAGKAPPQGKRHGLRPGVGMVSLVLTGLSGCIAVEGQSPGTSSCKDEGRITLNHRRHQEDRVLAENMTGKSFDLKVRDNGHDYEVYYNGENAGTGHYDRPEGHTCFRWGLYDKTVKHDALIFVTGVRFK